MVSTKLKGGESIMADKKKGMGRGWHGDSRGHAEAGRKGGLASRKKRQGKSM